MGKYLSIVDFKDIKTTSNLVLVSLLLTFSKYSPIENTVLFEV